MTPTPPFKAVFQEKYPYEQLIVDSEGEKVFVMEFENFGTAREENDFLKKVVAALNNSLQ